MKIQVADNAFVVPGLLTPGECRELIRRGEAIGFGPAAVRFASGARMKPSLRNNDRAQFQDPELARQLWQRCREHLPGSFDGGTPIGLDDDFRFYRYDVGQAFQRHMDGVTKKSEHVRSCFTSLFYLNGDFSGGRTVFYDSNGTRPEVASVTPRQGDALFFVHEWWHAGEAPTSGRKYVLRSDVLFHFPHQEPDVPRRSP